MEPNQTYKLLHTKEIINKMKRKKNEKATLKLEENICKQCNQQELNFHNIQIAQTAQYIF